MKTLQFLIPVAFVALFAGCATVTPKELVNARSAYQNASVGPAAQLAPAELHKANEALIKAEQSFQKDPESAQTKDLAYVAQRKSEQADIWAPPGPWVGAAWSECPPCHGRRSPGIDADRQRARSGAPGSPPAPGSVEPALHTHVSAIRRLAESRAPSACEGSRPSALVDRRDGGRAFTVRVRARARVRARSLSVCRRQVAPMCALFLLTGSCHSPTTCVGAGLRRDRADWEITWNAL